MAKARGGGAGRSGARTAHVALLRGVNVGGKNLLAMADLAEMFEEAGCAEVRTYIQSGNVVFLATASAAKGLAAGISKMIAERVGIRAPITLRTAEEMRRVALGNAFLTPKCDMKALYVGFLADEPEKAHVAGLNPERSPGDSYHVRGREIYMNLVTGAAKTKLTTAYFDAALKTVSTFRNWNTVLKLSEMSAALG